MRVPLAPSPFQLCLMLCLAALPCCVVGVQPPLTQSQASAGPPPPEPEQQPEPPPASEPHATDAVSPRATEWVRGYWHYDGLRYVWVPGRRQASSARFSWSEP